MVRVCPTTTAGAGLASGWGCTGESRRAATKCLGSARSCATGPIAPTTRPKVKVGEVIVSSNPSTLNLMLSVLPGPRTSARWRRNRELPGPAHAISWRMD
jgi:hypothetical protein